MILLSVDHLSLPRAGEIANGDTVVIRREPHASLVSVVDALGHGTRAAEVAALARNVLNEVALDKGVLYIVTELDRALRGSRGACALVWVATEKGIQGCSIGNVELRSSGLNMPFVLTPGVLGARVRGPRIFNGAPTRRARIVCYSDGVGSKFHLDEFSDLSTAEACKTIFSRHRRSHDDATLLVADVDV